jgi:hypothetical protein
VLNIGDLYGLEYLGRAFVIKPKLPPPVKRRYRDNDEDEGTSDG